MNRSTFLRQRKMGENCALAANGEVGGGGTHLVQSKEGELDELVERLVQASFGVY